jgi:hypothetical protein
MIMKKSTKVMVISSIIMVFVFFVQGVMVLKFSMNSIAAVGVSAVVAMSLFLLVGKIMGKNLR